MSILVVGAGFSGSVVARLLAEANHQIKVIDVRNHIAGNAYDYVNQYGIRIHKYGPHLFHTNNQKVFDWLNQFGVWVPYRHKVKAALKDGSYVTLPVNRETKDIVGEDKIIDMDSETLFFITTILNELNIDKLRNNILLKVLPLKV